MTERVNWGVVSLQIVDLVQPDIQFTTTEDGVGIAYWEIGSGPPLVGVGVAGGLGSTARRQVIARVVQPVGPKAAAQPNVPQAAPGDLRPTPHAAPSPRADVSNL